MESQVNQAYSKAFDGCQALLSRVFLLKPVSTLLASSAIGSLGNDEDLTIDSLPYIFVRLVESTPLQDRGQASYGICFGMMTLANANPTYIDDFLKVYFKAVEISSNQKLNSSEHTLAFQILMNMTETANTGYRSNDFCQKPGVFRPGKEDSSDASNVNFTKIEVEEYFDQVFKVSQQQAREGNDYIVRAAMFARFVVLVKETSPQWLEGYGVPDYGIETHLRRMVGPQGWMKPDIIAALIRLRGYAKSLSERFAALEKTQGKIGEWQGLLKLWLYNPEVNKTNDAIVKHHVILTLRNLRDGPFDETSEELFDARDWVF